MLKNFVRENFCCKTQQINSTKPRIEFFDLAKGICILLVVCLHSGIGTEIPMISALRMPLYFVLSGFFFKDYGSFMAFFIKKTNRLIIPLIFFMSIEICLLLIISPNTILHGLIAPFVKPGIINFPLWFLICLFWVNMFYYIIQKHIQHILFKICAIIIMGGIGYVLNWYEVYLPLFMSSAFSATPFFFVGVILRKAPLLYETKNNKYVILFGLALITATLTYCALNETPRIIFVQNIYSGNIFEIYAVALASVIGVLLLCKSIKWLPIISYLGRYSLIVLGLHIVFRNYAYLPIYKLTQYEFSSLEIFIITLFLCWISIPIVKKYFPKYSAQEDFIITNRQKRG